MSQAKLLRHLFALLISSPLLLSWAATASGEEGEKEILPFSDLVLTESTQRYSDKSECVAPVSDMRRHHMTYILHQRDETVREGIRTRRFSLEECVNCHAVKDEGGEYVRAEDERHFCTTCHTYTSTKMDCFECHADVPVRPSQLQSGLAPHHSNEPFAGKLASETLRVPTTKDQAP